MITDKDLKIMSLTEKGKREISDLIAQRKLEMSSKLPGFYTVCLGRKIYSKGIADCQ